MILKIQNVNQHKFVYLSKDPGSIPGGILPKLKSVQLATYKLLKAEKNSREFSFWISTRLHNIAFQPDF